VVEVAAKETWDTRHAVVEVVADLAMTAQMQHQVPALALELRGKEITVLHLPIRVMVEVQVVEVQDLPDRTQFLATSAVKAAME
jgi:hypothetical protein